MENRSQPTFLHTRVWLLLYNRQMTKQLQFCEELSFAQSSTTNQDHSVNEHIQMFSRDVKFQHMICNLVLALDDPDPPPRQNHEEKPRKLTSSRVSRHRSRDESRTACTPHIQHHHLLSKISQVKSSPLWEGGFTPGTATYEKRSRYKLSVRFRQSEFSSDNNLGLLLLGKLGRFATEWRQRKRHGIIVASTKDDRLPAWSTGWKVNFSRQYTHSSSVLHFRAVNL